MTHKLNTISLFASAGIGELLLYNSNLNIIAANELIPQRAACYNFFYPDTHSICGDIRDSKIKKEILEYSKDAKVLIATPPCQGLSTLGKNKTQEHFENDIRNFLIFDILDVIDHSNFDYILIENVPRFLEMYFPFNEELLSLENLLQKKYSDQYKIEARILNAKDYGICQSRPRAIVKIYKKNLSWPWPIEEKEISLSKAIEFLPSLESGEKSDIPWHYAKKHNERIIISLKHTETGKSALNNEVYYPKKEDGSRIKGFHNTYKRISWDQPCPARTTYSGSVSSHNNVHPGRKLQDGTYSDARVLTLLETFIVSSIPNNIEFPKNISESFIRTIIGESIPPLLMKKILEFIGG